MGQHCLLSGQTLWFLDCQVQACTMETDWPRGAATGSATIIFLSSFLQYTHTTYSVITMLLHCINTSNTSNAIHLLFPCVLKRLFSWDSIAC
jgi:hypothetical protein